jgi:hypothetical protein
MRFTIRDASRNRSHQPRQMVKRLLAAELATHTKLDAPRTKPSIKTATPTPERELEDQTR